MSEKNEPVQSMASKGGKAAAANMTAEERRERARLAAEARWSAGLPQASHEGVLKIGETEISCYVLGNGERVISTRGVMKALGRKWRGRKYSGTELPVFLEAKNLNQFISEDLRAVLSEVAFCTTRGMRAEGFKAKLLPLLCETYLKARDADALTGPQLKVAGKADILIRGLAHVGIIALVDEATGYQRVRAADELRQLLERYISKELAKWVHTFEPTFYEQLYRLRGWDRDHRQSKRPGCVAKYTVNLVYDRIHPDLLKELKQTREEWEMNGGKRGGKLFQFLTVVEGHPRLKQHLEGVTMVMRFSRNWNEMMERMDEAYPRINQTLRIPFPPDPEDELPPANPPSSSPTALPPPSGQSLPAVPG